MDSKRGGQVVVENAWKNLRSEGGVMGKLGRCAEELKDWNLMEFGNVLLKLRSVREELRELNKRGMTRDLVRRRRFLEEKERDLMAKEELLWF